MKRSAVFRYLRVLPVIFFALLGIHLFMAFFPENILAVPPSTSNPSAWVTDGTVYAIAPAGPITYIGGNFNYVGPNTGAFVSLDPATGYATSPYARVNGPVFAVIPDGSGGWYIGGNFTGVLGVARNNLAHILADGSLDLNWNPDVTGSVSCLAKSGGTIYIGGAFARVNNQTRNFLAAIDAATGALLTWNPDANGPVHALAIGRGGVYVGGEFTSVGNQTRNCLAAVDISGTGTVTAWNPDANSAVHALAVSGTAVFAGGEFTYLGGQEKYYLAALDDVTGEPRDWAPGSSTVWSLATSPTPGALYAGGSSGITAYNTSSGEVKWSWIDYEKNPTIFALAVDGLNLYAGGGSGLNTQVTGYLLALDADNGAGGYLTPVANEVFRTLAANNGKIFAGGNFTSFGVETRYQIAAVHSSTGIVTPWNPNAGWQMNDMRDVRAILINGEIVYTGGTFMSIGGQWRNGIAALDAVTGAALPAWDPSADGPVYTLAETEGVIFAGGEFTTIGGQPRNRIAALDALTGAVTSWDPTLGFTNFALGTPAVHTIVINGTLLYVGGSFSHVGAAQRNALAAIDMQTGAATEWNPNADGAVRTLAISGATVYVGGYFQHFGSTQRVALAAIDIASGIPTSFNPWPGGVPFALLVSGETLYVGGQFNFYVPPARRNLAAFDLTTGTRNSWNPDPEGAVYALAVSGGRVYAGGSFKQMGKYSQSGFALFGSSNGDFNGDGNPDLVWRNTETGRTTIWFITGATWNGGFADIEPTLNDQAWSLVGVADFNGDGSPDLLWRNSQTGRTTIWYMDGPTWNGGYADVEPTLNDQAWSIVGIADFNGDGDIDLLWRNSSTGRTTIWYMTGPTWNGGYADVEPTLNDSNWSIVGIADFNGDSNPDLLWRNSSDGRTVIWYMTGPVWNGGYAEVLPTLNDPNWSIVAVRDFNNDGSPDLLWRNTSSTPADPNAYRTTVWYMNGPIWNGNWGELLPIVPSSDWIVIGK
jgi:trimeric autotransporter adhesin